MSTAIGHPVLDHIARALESGDRDALASLYAPGAEFVSTDGAHPPASPMRLAGTAVVDYVRAIPADVRMVLDHALVGTDGRLVMTITCHFPSGGSALSSHVLALDDEGRIVSHRTIEAADG
jgi:hypothetical protein